MTPGGSGEAANPTRYASDPRGGRISGAVSALGVKGDAVKAANVLVQLWRVDSRTTGSGGTACSAWSSDNGAWIAARQELDDPSGIDISATRVGSDVTILRSLLAMRLDTVRTNGDFFFIFRDVPPGAYTVQAEALANGTFVQWVADVVVRRNAVTPADLNSSEMRENQFCAVSADTSNLDRVYDAREVDKPLEVIGGFASLQFPSLKLGGSVTITFVVNEAGIPDISSVSVTPVPQYVTKQVAQDFASRIRFASPTVHGHPVKVRTAFTIRKLESMKEY